MVARVRIRIWLWWLRLAVSRGGAYRQSILVGSVLRLRGVLLITDVAALIGLGVIEIIRASASVGALFCRTFSCLAS